MYHIIKFEDLPDLRLCHDDGALGEEVAWLLDTSGEQAVKKAAWNKNLNGYSDADVSPELFTRCDVLLQELFARLEFQRTVNSN